MGLKSEGSPRSTELLNLSGKTVIEIQSILTNLDYKLFKNAFAGLKDNAMVWWRNGEGEMWHTEYAPIATRRGETTYTTYLSDHKDQFSTTPSGLIRRQCQKKLIRVAKK